MLAELIPKVAAQEAEEKGEQAYRPRPSLAGPERCVRQLVYFARDTEKDKTNDRKWLVFDDSSWHEELTADWIRKTSYQIHSQQMELETLCGKGHIDGIVTDLLGEDYLYEHKALNHFSFERLWHGAWPNDYLTQVALYMEALQKIQPKIRKAVLLIKNKNTAQYMEMLCSYENDTISVFEMTRSDGEKKDVSYSIENVTAQAVSKFATVAYHIDTNTLPERPFEFGTVFPCDYCPYKSKCWEGYEEEFVNLKKGIKLPEDVSAWAWALDFAKVQKKVLELKIEKHESNILGFLTAVNYSSGIGGGFEVTKKINKKSVSLKIKKIGDNSDELHHN